MDSNVSIHFKAYGVDNVKQKISGLNTASIRATSGLGKLNRSVDEIGGKRTEIAADVMKDFFEELGRGEGIANALRATIGPLAGGMMGLGTAISLGLAVVLPVAIAGLAGMIGEAKTLQEQLAELTSVTDSYVEAVNNTKMSIEELSEKYGQYADRIRPVLESLKELERIETDKKIRETTAAILEFAGEVDATGQESISAWALVDSSVNKLKQTFGVTAEEASKLRPLFTELSSAAGPQEMLDIWDRIQEIIGTTPEAIARFDEKGREVKINMDKLYVTTTEFADAQGTATENIDEGAAKAAILAANMGDVASAAGAAMAAIGGVMNGLDAQIANTEARVRALRDGLDETTGSKLIQEIDAGLKSGALSADQAAAAYQKAQEQSQALIVAQQKLERMRGTGGPIGPSLPKSTGASVGAGGGGSSRGSSGSGGLQTSGLIAADELKDTFVSANDEMTTLSQSMAKWAEDSQVQITDVASVWQNGITGMSQTFANFLTTGKLDFESFINSMIQNFAQLAMQNLFFGGGGGGGLLSGIFGGGGGGGGGINAVANAVAGSGGMYFNGGIVKQPTKFFANGGLASMSEKGAEAIFPLTRDSNGRLAVHGVGGDGGGGLTINMGGIHIEHNGNATSEDSQQMGRILEGVIEKKMTDILARHERNNNQNRYRR